MYSWEETKPLHKDFCFLSRFMWLFLKKAGMLSSDFDFFYYFLCVLSKRSEMFTFHISTFLTHDLLIFVHLALFNTQTICIIFQLICDPVDIIKSLNVDFELQFLLFIDICQNGGGSSDSPN